MNQRASVLRTRVHAVEEIADRVLMVTFAESHGGLLPRWEPGAHIDVPAGQAGTRQYSLCGSPDDLRFYQIAVLHDSEGRGGSTWVHTQLAVGDPVEIGAPRNNFRLAEASNYLFIAGGIGITPIMPMVAAVDASGHKWRLLYGGRHRGAMAFVEQVQGLDRARGRVFIRPEDEFGRLDLDKFVDAGSPDSSVYACGPPGLLDAVSEVARERSLDVHMERFASGAASADTSDVGRTSFDVVCARSGVTLHVEPGRSVLQTVLDAGIAVDYSCTEGFCGTCETTVLAGVPDHRDQIYGSWGTKPDDRMLICVSRSRTPTIELDL